MLKHTDNLSMTLQNPKLRSSEGRQIAELTRKTLEHIRTNDSFSLFWSKVTPKQEMLNVNDPVLPRKRRVPARFAVLEQVISQLVLKSYMDINTLNVLILSFLLLRINLINQATTL